MMNSEFDELKKKTLQRQRQKTNLVEHQAAIQKMMELDISLPVVLEWLVEKKSISTTLPALRRFVKKIFGQEFYDKFTERNGWKKNKMENKAIARIARKSTQTGCSGDKEQETGSQGDLVGLSRKQLRERHADKFINSETTNPLLKYLMEKIQ